ncbi:dihydropteroate synthase [Alteriqipengyuania lutimaris]|uniref:dihydropteroate synthase n=1 Tax=Alteriqipengyuania lutimaris TaxID=1538146 RepID=A0A395LLE2_9SPHN|nr:dihydropteroate synthase [Alteriqipengyuania lutimaris]MBB3033290.1 dihydropteroate synthase [Alteriqipengyuania lutimaris]RDS77671.1 dihydropteroate synthase [Alteriqipengyuania lutimaris]
MSETVYIRPIGFAPGPQSEEGDAVRLGGGLVYASRFVVIYRRDGEVIERWRSSPESIAQVLAELPNSVAAEAEAQWSNLRNAHPPLELGARTIRLDQPQVMGILNVTPDSFSDGGKHVGDPAGTREAIGAMVEAGAAIIDIGGESTRPGADAVWEEEEIRRIVPAVEAAASMGAAVSIDTRRAGTMEAALQAGAAIVNDVSALRYDPRSAELVAKTGCPVVLMHAPGKGKDLHEGGTYESVVFDVFDALRERRDAAVAAGIERSKILLDPGLGFGKSLGDNLALINALPLFHALGQPILFGASRKRMIGALSKEAAADARLGGSIALAIAAMDAGAHILRVHDVPESVQARDVWRGLRDNALTDFADLPG